MVLSVYRGRKFICDIEARSNVTDAGILKAMKRNGLIPRVRDYFVDEPSIGEVIVRKAETGRKVWTLRLVFAS